MSEPRFEISISIRELKDGTIRWMTEYHSTDDRRTVFGPSGVDTSIKSAAKIAGAVLNKLLKHKRLPSTETPA